MLIRGLVRRRSRVNVPSSAPLTLAYARVFCFSFQNDHGLLAWMVVCDKKYYVAKWALKNILGML